MAKKCANKLIWLPLKIVNIQAFKRSTWMWLFVNYVSRLFREIEKYVWTLLNKYYFKRTIRASSRWQCRLFLRQVLQVKRLNISDVAVKKNMKNVEIQKVKKKLFEMRLTWFSTCKDCRSMTAVKSNMCNKKAHTIQKA